MTPRRWERIKELLEAALELAPEGRRDFLVSACGDDGPIRLEVERLLIEYDRAGGFLEPILPALTQLAQPEETLTFQVSEIAAGRFRIVRFIGHGGMGQVYEAEDLDLHEPVALKTLRPDIAAGARYFEAVRREVHHARRVTHPNVNRIFDLQRHRGLQGDAVPFLTMELLEGETLAERLRREGSMPASQALPLIQQMAAGLDAAHDAGIVHRDFKPGNVMLVPSSRPEGAGAVITDFGLARGVGAQSKAEPSAPSASGAFGTPPYAAPEQLEGGPITPATDIYGFGAVLREMLQPDIDPQWQRVIRQCLGRDPADRFPTATEVVRALTAQPRADRSTVALPAIRSRRRWTGWLVTTGAALVILAIAILLVSQPANPELHNPMRITNDGLYKGRLWLRRQTLFFDSNNGELPTVMRTPAQGGGVQAIPIASGLRLFDVSADRSELLVMRSGEQRCPCPLFAMPTAGGSLRKLAYPGNAAAWSPDGKSLAFTRRRDLYLANPDGTNPRKLAELPLGGSSDLCWSPDGTRLRLGVEDPEVGSYARRLYDVDVKRPVARRLLPGWTRKAQDNEAEGKWTSNGEFFVFAAVHDGTSGIWAIRERHSLLSAADNRPFLLTHNPEDVRSPTPSEDGRKLFTMEAGPKRGELLRYDG